MRLSDEDLSIIAHALNDRIGNMTEVIRETTNAMEECPYGSGDSDELRNIRHWHVRQRDHAQAMKERILAEMGERAAEEYRDCYSIPV